MDETIYVILKVLFDFALEVWFSILTSWLLTVWYAMCNYLQVDFWLSDMQWVTMNKLTIDCLICNE